MRVPERDFVKKGMWVLVDGTSIGVVFQPGPVTNKMRKARNLPWTLSAREHVIHMVAPDGSTLPLGIQDGTIIWDAIINEDRLTWAGNGLKGEEMVAYIPVARGGSAVPPPA